MFDESYKFITFLMWHWHHPNDPILPRCAPFQRLRFAKHIKVLSERIMTTHRLLIAVEYALPNWSLVDFGKECCRR